MNTILAGAERRGELTDSDREHKRELKARLEDIDGRLEKIADDESRENMAAEARARAERFIRPTGGSYERRLSEKDQEILNFFRDPNQRSIEISFSDVPFESRMLAASTEARSNLNVGTYGSGGATVPTDFVSRLYQTLVWNSQVLRAGATVLPSDNGRTLVVPKTSSHPVAGTIVSEGATIGENEPVFAAGTLHAYKYASLVQVSRELIEDTEIDLLGYLASILGRQIANGFGAHFTTGTGSSQPTGFVKTGGTVYSGGTGQSGKPTADELIEVYYNLSEPYRESPTARWFMSNTAAKAIRQLKASTAGTYQWVLGLNGAPNELFGAPVLTDPNMPAVATSATSIAYGDFSAYQVRMTPLRLERSEDFAFDRDISTWRVAIRADGLSIDSNAFSFYVGGTS